MIKKLSRGFTFLELVIVILILGIVIGVSVPLMRARFASARLEDCTYRLEKMLNYSWQRSLLVRHRLRVYVDASKKNYWLTAEVVNEDSVEFKKLKGKYGRVFSFPEEITVITEKPYYDFAGTRGHDRIAIVLSNEKNDRFIIASDGRFEPIQAHPQKEDNKYL